MDSRITPQDTGLRVQIDQSRTRQAPRTDFGSMVGRGLSKTADAVMTAGQLAAPFIPGGAVLSAAITGVGQLKSGASARTAGGGGIAVGANATPLSPTSGTAGSVGSGRGITTPALDGSLGGAAATHPNDAMASMRTYMAESMSMNVQYLQLQNQMQMESRNFTTLSNVMKTKHDTAKNAINNVR